MPLRHNRVMPQAPRKVRIVTLGCAKNEVDSEEIAGVLQDGGYEVDAETKAPDLTIINTCAFVESAQRESIEAIRKAVRSKGVGKVIVAGCLVQRLGEELKRLAPGADGYVGVGQMGRFGLIAEQVFGRTEPVFEVDPPQHRWAEVGSRARSGKPWSAYLKISEGCDHHCAFCTIPSFRGRHVSKPIERILDEARTLIAGGVKELNIIAQDVTQYGHDLYGEYSLARLLRELDAVPGVEWIRLLYCYPSLLDEEVIQAIAGLPHVVKYVDVPLQHASGPALRRMKRPGDGERYLKLVEKLRAAMPDGAIRTTFIVGFPGETDIEFAELLAFVKQAKLDRVGAFMYSRETGTPAHDLPGQLPMRVKRARLDRLMRAQQEISLERNRAWEGRTLRVLVEEQREGWLLGRSHRDAPEIDGVVYARGAVEPGSFVDVQVTQGREYDLYGVVEGTAPSRGLTPLRMADPKRPL